MGTAPRGDFRGTLVDFFQLFVNFVLVSFFIAALQRRRNSYESQYFLATALLHILLLLSGGTEKPIDLTNHIPPREARGPQAAHRLYIALTSPKSHDCVSSATR